MRPVLSDWSWRRSPYLRERGDELVGTVVRRVVAAVAPGLYVPHRPAAARRHLGHRARVDTVLALRLLEQCTELALGHGRERVLRVLLRCPAPPRAHGRGHGGLGSRSRGLVCQDQALRGLVLGVLAVLEARQDAPESLARVRRTRAADHPGREARLGVQEEASLGRGRGLQLDDVPVAEAVARRRRGGGACPRRGGGRGRGRRGRRARRQREGRFGRGRLAVGLGRTRSALPGVAARLRAEPDAGPGTPPEARAAARVPVGQRFLDERAVVGE